MMLGSGMMLADRYRLGRRIAVGGMGEVWEAADTRLDRNVAVKVLKPELTGDPEFVHRFRSEARTTAGLSHPGIASVHDYGEVPTGPNQQNLAFLVMELLPGEPLAALLGRAGRLAPGHVLDILEQAGNALQAAHTRGLVHRDIKPGNIMIMPNGQVKITDFGIARAVDSAPVTRAGMVMGTAHYIAPEQAAGQDAGPASDVYALGVVGFECLAGRRPFDADTAVALAMKHMRDVPPQLPADVPRDLRTMLDATLVKDPRQRYGSGGEFAHAVAMIRSGQPLPLPRGVSETAATELLGGGYPETALLPPGALTQVTRANYAPPTPPPPPTGPYPGGPPSRYDDEDREPKKSNAAAWLIGGLLLAALLVVLGFFINSAFNDDDDSPDPVVSSTAPVPPVVSTPEDTTEETGTSETTTSSSVSSSSSAPAPDTVEINDSDYIGLTGSDAAADLEALGLEPTVEDLLGEELTSAEADECTVTGVEPDGEVEEGSSVTVTCQ